jgi:molybdopterin-binding protein
VTAPLIEVRDLAVEYRGRRVLEVGHLAVRPSEVLALVGPNGAGKSTLLRVLALLEAPTRGTVHFAGRPVQFRAGELLALRRRMATVFQAPLLFDTTVRGNVALPLRFRRLGAVEIDRRVEPWLRRFGIAELASRSARTLSGGEAQRTSLARAFVLEPEVLFLDEPFGALDAPTRESLLFDLQAALRDAGTTAVFVTHDRSEALMFGDRLAVVMGGRIHQVDLPDRVFAAPATEDVARFVGADTIIAGVVRARRDDLCVVGVGSGEMQVESDAQPGERLLVCLRPEDVVLARAHSRVPPTSMRNALVGKVQRIAPLGSQVRVDVDAGVPLRALITKQALAELALGEGQEIWACFKATAAHVIRRRDVGGT